MSRIKYYYDPETLSYREIKVTNKLRFSNFMLFIFSSFLFGLVSLFIILNTDIIDTPTEMNQNREVFESVIKTADVTFQNLDSSEISKIQC